MMETMDGEVVSATRPKAVPPDERDCLRYSSREVEGMVDRFLTNAWLDGHRFRRMVRRAQRRFGLTYTEARTAMREVADRYRGMVS
jgi:hypothetical protein